MKHWQKFRSKRIAVQAMLVLAGIGALILGIYASEASTVLTKATYICLECIGIG